MMISVIANFYKSEEYIPKLIDSVLGQSYTDWELVCVNDCSPGNDLDILKKYAAKDSRIRIINNEVNLGICKAKYRGIQEAKGTYLCFIDGDDWLEPEALQKMIVPALKYDLDYVCMDSQKVLPFFGHKVPFCVDRKYKERVIEIDTEVGAGRKNFEELYRNFFGKNLFMVTYWGKLIKKQLIEESGFTPPSSVISEDQVFNMTLFPNIKKMMFVDYIGYNWRWGGVTSGKSNDFWKEKQYVARANELYAERVETKEEAEKFAKQLERKPMQAPQPQKRLVLDENGNFVTEDVFESAKTYKAETYGNAAPPAPPQDAPAPQLWWRRTGEETLIIDRKNDDYKVKEIRPLKKTEPEETTEPAENKEND